MERLHRDSKLISLIKLAILVITLLLWSVIGLIFWIPVLVRSVATFASMILYAALTGTDASAASKQMQLAISFYADGFRKNIDALYAPSQGSSDKGQEHKFSFGRFMAEIVWTIFFWYAVFAWLLDMPVLEYSLQWLQRTFQI